jgi:hypothetical protein
MNMDSELVDMFLIAIGMIHSLERDHLKNYSLVHH